LPGASVICIYGLDEAALVGCTLPQLNGATVIALPGGHHFDNNATALGDRVIAALKAKGLP
jgi:type IV secretory pathway VirJ component